MKKIQYCLVKRLLLIIIPLIILTVTFGLSIFTNAANYYGNMIQQKNTARNPDDPDYPKTGENTSERIEIMYGDLKNKEIYYVPELDGIVYYTINVKYMYKNSSQDILWPQDVIWSTSNEEIAEIKDNGTIIPKSEGTVCITAEYNNLYDSIEIIVKKSGLEKLEIQEEGLNQRYVFAVTSDGRKFDITENKDIIWAANDGTVFTIDSGNIHIKEAKNDQVVLTAMFKGITSTTVLNRKESVINPEKIKISKNQVLIDDINGCCEVSAKAEFSDGNIKDISNIVSWESENPDVAIVNNGTIYAVNEGETIINISYAEFHDTVRVNIKQHDYGEKVLHSLP